MPVITHAGLVDGLIDRARRGAFFVCLEALTDPHLRKRGNDLAGKVRKRQIVNAVLNWQYERSVNRQREREGSQADFKASARLWGTRVRGTPLVRYREKLYVEAKVQHMVDCGYELLDGTVLDAALVTPFLPARSSGAEAQGVQSEIILRDFAVESIVALTVDGERYEIAPTPAHAKP